MFKDVAPKPKPGGVKRARRFRREMSLPEVLLWQALRTRPEALKLRQQHPSGDYTLDFYCGDARLAIEIDGEAHSRGDQPVRDAARDGWFEQYGIMTLRVPAVDVLRDVDAVVRWIVDTARSRLPLHRAASRRGPPPRHKLGED